MPLPKLKPIRTRVAFESPSPSLGTPTPLFSAGTPGSLPSSSRSSVAPTSTHAISSLPSGGGGRTPRTPRTPAITERQFLLGLLLYTALIFFSLSCAIRYLTALEAAAAGRTAPGDPASTSRRPRHRRLLESADAAGALASGRAGGAGGRRSSLLPPQLIANSLASLNASAMLLEPKVDVVLSQGALQDRHEQYACGGSPALPLRLSDEALVILRHLRQLERLPAQGGLRPLLVCGSCAVVGGSASLAGSGLGKWVDDRDCVIRLGAEPTVGFVADVGSKTTARLLDFAANSSQVQVWHEPQDAALLLGVSSVHHLQRVAAAWAAAGIPPAPAAAGGQRAAAGAAQPGGARRLAGARVGEGGSESSDQGRSDSAAGQYLLNPAWWCWLHRWTGNAKAQPSLGFAAVLAALDVCTKQVNVFGLDYDSPEAYTYYASSWEEGERQRALEYQVHPLAEERQIYSQLEALGLVKLHAPSPQGRLLAAA